MHRLHFVHAQGVVGLMTVLLIPSILWAAEPRGIEVHGHTQVRIAAMSNGTVTAVATRGPRALKFGEAVTVGEQVVTGEGAMADMLIGKHAVLTMGPNTQVELRNVSPEQTTVHLETGILRAVTSAAALEDQGIFIIQTPTNQVTTQGSIVRVSVSPSAPALAYAPNSDGKVSLVTYAPPPVIAAAKTSGDVIHVEEGTVEVSEVGSSRLELTLQAGQKVMLQTGQPGQALAIVEPELPDALRIGVIASPAHTNTPKSGVEHLVALQVDQATALGHALTGAAKTGQDESNTQDDSNNAINGATGGVQVASTLVNTLFGTGTVANPGTTSPINSTGGGFSVQNSDTTPAFLSDNLAIVKVNGGENARLVFTKKEPIESIVIDEKTFVIDGSNVTFEAGSPCDAKCVAAHEAAGQSTNLNFPPLLSNGIPIAIPSDITVERELILMGGTPNNFHGEVAPAERLIVRGPEPRFNETTVSNIDINPEPINPGLPTFEVGLPKKVLAENSTFVIRNGEDNFGNTTKGVQLDILNGGPLFGGILGQFANDSRGPATTLLEILTEENENEPNGFLEFLNEDVTLAIPSQSGNGVTAAITATGANIELIGGVILDRETIATIGTTKATNNYFNNNIPATEGVLAQLGATFDGSLLAIIDRPTGPTALTVQDRLLGVYDGSTIKTNGGNKALLSVLDAKLTGPENGSPLLDVNAAFLDADMANGMGRTPEVTVTSAVVTRSTKPLDGALLEASAPLLALTQAEMTTTSHFADLAGNATPSLQLNDALVALNASDLLIQNGHLLNLNNATATVNGYLFSLTNGSTLDIKNGTLFSVNNESALTLNANALGVFGNGSNTLAITNNLCTGACGTLVNSANTPFLVEGQPLKVAGVTQNVVLPNNVNVFAVAPNAQPNVTIEPNAALFQVDSTSTLTINGAVVVEP